MNTVILGAGVVFPLSIPDVFPQQDAMMVICVVIQIGPFSGPQAAAQKGGLNEVAQMVM